MMTAIPSRAPHVSGVALAATCLIAAALALYVTELSPATALVIAPFALCLFGAAWSAHHRGRWPSKPWRITFAGLAMIAVVCGLALYIYGQLHPPTTG